MMKYFVAIALIAAVASAGVVRPTAITGELAEIQEIIAAIQSPSTNPATAAALQDMLFELLGLEPTPISVGPAIVDVSPVHVVDSAYEPIAVGPAIVDFPVEVAPVVVPSPAPVAEASASAPLVQIILNIQSSADVSPIAVSPVGGVEAGSPVQIIDSAPGVIERPTPVTPVQVVEEAAPVTPVEVVETAPVVVEPVIIGTPTLPEPVVLPTPELTPVEPVIIGTPIIAVPAILPEELN